MRSLHSGTAFTLPTPGSEFPAPSASESDKREWTISEMARDYGLTLRALRFYESKGLISPQRFGGARYYSARDRVRLTLILNAKRMGFTLSETADMLGKTSDGEMADLPLSADTVETQIAFLESQRSAIEAALGALRQRRQEMSSSAA